MPRPTFYLLSWGVLKKLSRKKNNGCIWWRTIGQRCDNGRYFKPRTRRRNSLKGHSCLLQVCLWGGSVVGFLKLHDGLAGQTQEGTGFNQNEIGLFWTYSAADALCCAASIGIKWQTYSIGVCHWWQKQIHLFAQTDNFIRTQALKGLRSWIQLFITKRWETWTESTSAQFTVSVLNWAGNEH